MSEDLPAEQLDALLELQKTDNQIARLEHKLDALPEQQALDDAQRRHRELTEAHDAKRVDIDRARSENSRLDGEVDLLRQRHSAEQARMYGGEISNPKELQSLRAEIDSTERRIGEQEDRLLEVMEQRESLEQSAAELQEQAEQLSGEMERLEVERDDAAKGLLAELGEAKAARDTHRETIPDDLLDRYERARKGGGAAVGQLVDGMCTACRIELPIAEVNALLDGPPLATCPNCQRMLVVRLGRGSGRPARALGHAYSSSAVSPWSW